MYYATTRPHHPDPAVGRVYVINNHGTYSYLTRSEQWRLWCLEFGAPIAFLTALALTKRWKISTGSFTDIPKNVRQQILRGPPRDYDKIRATYARDKKDDDFP